MKKWSYSMRHPQAAPPAEPMDADERRAHYLKQCSNLTPAQVRRLRKKLNRQLGLRDEEAPE